MRGQSASGAPRRTNMTPSTLAFSLYAMVATLAFLVDWALLASSDPAHHRFGVVVYR